MFPLSTSCARVLTEATIGRRSWPLDWIGTDQIQHLPHGIIDEDEADEGTEPFLCESGKVAHQQAGLRSHQRQAECGHPDADPQAEGQVVQVVISVRVRDSQGCLLLT